LWRSIVETLPGTARKRAHIAVEELAEVVHAATLAQQGLGPQSDVDKELIQLAAVVTAWIEARARR